MIEVTVNNKIYQVPFLLSEISLTHCVNYYEKYGHALDKEFLEIINRAYPGTEDEREIQRNSSIENHMDQKAMAWYAYWTGYDLNDLKNFPHIDPVLKQYRQLHHLLADPDDLIGFETE